MFFFSIYLKILPSSGTLLYPKTFSSHAAFMHFFVSGLEFAT